MKKIFTLSLALIATLSASAQAKYGLYTELINDQKQIAGIMISEEVYDYGVYSDNEVAVSKAKGSECFSYLDVVAAHPEVSRFSGYYNAGHTGGSLLMGGEIWGVYDDILLYSTSKDGTDAESSSRWVKVNPDGSENEVGQDWDLVATAPGYWAGFSVDIPSGKALNVNAISINMFASNNYVWCINIVDEAGNVKYNTGNAKMSNSNNYTNNYMWQCGTSAYITSSSVREISGWVTGDDVDQSTLSGTSPVKAFNTLPEGGLSLTGKNTIRVYFAVKNARLIGFEHFWLEGTLGDPVPGGISNITVDAAENAQAYNLAGQAVGASYKGVVIKDGKKFRQN